MVHFLGSNYLIAFPFTGVISETIDTPNVHLQSDQVSFKVLFNSIKY